MRYHLGALAALTLLPLAACGRQGLGCYQRADPRARHIVFERCMEASAAIITAGSASRSEAHETVDSCGRNSFSQTAYYWCPGDAEPAPVNEEWLHEIGPTPNEVAAAELAGGRDVEP